MIISSKRLQFGEGRKIYTLYLDASGDPGWCQPYGNSDTKWYVLGGLALETNFIEDVDKGVRTILAEYSDLAGNVIPELKYSALNSGNPDYYYNCLEGFQRKRMADDVVSLLLESEPTLFAIAVNKNAHCRQYINPYDPNLLAWRFMATKYDKFLTGKSDSGFMYMDKEDTRTNRDFDKLIADARENGIFLKGSSGKYNDGPNSNLTSIKDIDFSNSEESPGIQLADFCAHIVWRSVERNQGNRFAEIRKLFDTFGIKRWPY